MVSTGLWFLLQTDGLNSEMRPYSDQRFVEADSEVSCTPDCRAHLKKETVRLKRSAEATTGLAPPIGVNLTGKPIRRRAFRSRSVGTVPRPPLWAQRASPRSPLSGQGRESRWSGCIELLRGFAAWPESTLFTHLLSVATNPKRCRRCSQSSRLCHRTPKGPLSSSAAMQPYLGLVHAGWDYFTASERASIGWVCLLS